MAILKQVITLCHKRMGMMKAGPAVVPFQLTELMALIMTQLKWNSPINLRRSSIAENGCIFSLVLFFPAIPTFTRIHTYTHRYTHTHTPRVTDKEGETE